MPGIYAFDCVKHAKPHYKYQYRANRKQRWATVHDSLAVARRARDSARSEAEQLAPGSERTLNDLVRSHLHRLEPPVVVYGTYTAKVSTWAIVADELGETRLPDLEADTVQEVLLHLLEPDETRERKKGGYDLTTVQHVRAFLCEVTADAKVRRRFLHDPLAGGILRLPKEQPAPPSFLDPAQLLKAWEVLQGDELGRLLLGLHGFMGLRRGESLAIQGSRVDSELPRYLKPSERPAGLHTVYVTRVIEKIKDREVVREFPKSPASVRVVFVPSMIADAVLAAAGQAGDRSLFRFDEALKSRLSKVNNEWTSRCFKLVAAGLPKVGLHELRHSYATLLAEARVFEFVAKRLLGHAVPGMTGVYTHITWAQLEAARADVDRYLASIATGSDGSME